MVQIIHPALSSETRSEPATAAQRPRRTVDAATLRLLSVESGSDPRSVMKRLRGQTVRGVAGMRIDNVLRARGFLP